MGVSQGPHAGVVHTDALLHWMVPICCEIPDIYLDLPSSSPSKQPAACAAAPSQKEGALLSWRPSQPCGCSSEGSRHKDRRLLAWWLCWH